MKLTRHIFPFLIGFFPLGAAGALYHAPDEQTETQPDSLVKVLEGVSVTSVKQASRLRESPEAVTILTGKALEEIGALNLRGISDVVPNFYMPEYGSRITSTIYVRGIGARMDNPSVGLNVDNVPYLNKDAYDFDIADIANVEMLRGPQSTLYGRNTMAGVINITTLSPMQFQGWKIMAEGANGGRGKLSLGWYHRFNRKLGLAATGSYSHQDGFFTNEYNGKKLDKENNWSGRVRLNWNINRELTVQNVAAVNFLRQGGYPYEFKKTGKISYNDTCFYRRMTFTDGLTLRYSHDKFTLTSITAVQHLDDNMTLDQDFLPEEYFTLTQKKRDTAISEDMVFRGKRPGSAYNWLAGVFGFYKHLDMQAPVTFKDKGISDLIEQNRNNANPSFPIRWNSRSFTLNSDFRNNTVGLAVYHKSSVTLGNFDIDAALRLDYERSELHYDSYCATSYSIYQNTQQGLIPYHEVPVNINDKGDLSRTFLTLLPELAATYRVSDYPANIYAKISKGYKAGGFNTQMFSDVLQQRLMGIMGIGAQYDVDDVVGYKPEESWNYEIGSHLNLFDSRLTLDLALFYIDCRNQQLTMFPDGTTTGRIMTNAGKTRSFGGEISVMWRATSELIFNGSYGYTNARFREFFNGISDYKGRYLPYAPRNTVFLQGLYTLHTGVGVLKDIVFDVNLRATGKIYWNESNADYQPLYALLGAGITIGDERINLQVWGRNLTDTRYRTFYFMSMGNEFFQRGKGIEFGATLRLSI
ncbi:MAG: TonB-dependent receptor [Muribaculaceae bacterium]|nr:TonB-dependent receptor [Muribaculaceae bacterium]